MTRVGWRSKRNTKTPTKKFDVSDVSHIAIDVSKIDREIRAASQSEATAINAKN